MMWHAEDQPDRAVPAGIARGPRRVRSSMPRAACGVVTAQPLPARPPA